MTHEGRKAKYLIDRFHGNKDHAIVCVLEILKDEEQCVGNKTPRYQYWNKVLEILKEK